MTKTDLNLPPPQINFTQHNANIQRLMYYSGKWVAGSYEVQEVKVHKGQAWVCIVATATEPGTFAGQGFWDQLGGSTAEIWEATAILGMTAQTIQWTFIPIFTGQTPVLLTEAAGVFTFVQGGVVTDFAMQIFVSHELAANNSESSFTITPTYSGIGVSTMLPTAGFAASTRIGSFTDSKYSEGAVIPVASDTISFLADSTGTNGSDVDLLNMFVTVVGPRP